MLLAHDALVCGRCGNLRSVCSDPSIDWHPREEVCWPSASADWGVRRLQEKYKDAKPGPDDLHPLDGVRVGASQLPPDPDSDVFA